MRFISWTRPHGSETHTMYTGSIALFLCPDLDLLKHFFKNMQKFFLKCKQGKLRDHRKRGKILSSNMNLYINLRSFYEADILASCNT
jgi:hypothetical protein